MGWWKSSCGTIGDSVADIMDAAIHKIEAEYQEYRGRLPTQGELADLIEFSTCGVLVPVCGDPKFPFSKKSCHEDDTPRAVERGQQGVFGEASMKYLKKRGICNVPPRSKSA